MISPRFVAICLGLMLLSACAGTATVPIDRNVTASSLLESRANDMAFEHACGPAAVGFARCHALVSLNATSGPSGYNPANLRAAYSLPSTTAPTTTQTVALVDAYDDPKAQSDMNVYRSKFGITACTTSNGCFRKVNQSGGTSYPRGDRGWAEEISLDLDMVSAICPKCHILLVEATNSSLSNLLAGVNEAVKLGANEVSNSWGGSEFSTETSYSSTYFNHPGHVITASSGDSGYGVEFPASSQYVTAVGGTTLTKSTTGTYSEKAWSGAGSGCSAYIGRPSWQSSLSNITNHCSKRAVADVSADADPHTGVSVYDTYNQSGWLVFGGTSVSAPIIASVYALAGNASTVTAGSYPYSHTSYLHDITSGRNGSCGNQLCNAVSGWDGPTGLGTPKGTGAF